MVGVVVAGRYTGGTAAALVAGGGPYGMEATVCLASSALAVADAVSAAAADSTVP